MGLIFQDFFPKVMKLSVADPIIMSKSKRFKNNPRLKKSYPILIIESVYI